MKYVETRHRASVGGSIVLAVALMGCGRPDQCERVETITVPAQKGCPSAGKVAEDRKHAIRADLAEAVLDPAVTICWYRAERTIIPPGRDESVLDECWEPRSHAALSDDHRTYGLNFHIMSCDEDGILFGHKIRGPRTLEEALPATESECPDVAEAAEIAEHWEEGLVVSEFVGTDFFEPLLHCAYDFVYKCRENHGGGSADWGF